MITGLDHIVVLVRDLDQSGRIFTLVSGRLPVWQASTEGAATCLFNLGNVVVELMAPVGSGTAADRIRAAIDQQGEGLASLCFRVDDIAKTCRKLNRVRLEPEAVTEGASTDLSTGSEGARRTWLRTRAATTRTRGVRMFFLQPHEPLPVSPIEAVDGGELIGLDHIVIASPDAEAAAVLYGARLGLEMALDRVHPDWGQLMFFRCGDLIVEIVQRKQHEGPVDVDRFYGLSWRVADLDAARARLLNAGVDVSDIREGRNPGTRVVTVRDMTLGIATLLVERERDRR